MSNGFPSMAVEVRQHCGRVFYVRSHRLDHPDSHHFPSPVSVTHMKMNRQILMLCFVLAVAGSLGACSHGRTVEAAREERQPTVTPAEQEFMMKAADAMLSNVDVARLAMHKSRRAKSLVLVLRLAM